MTFKRTEPPAARHLRIARELRVCLFLLAASTALAPGCGPGYSEGGSEGTDGAGSDAQAEDAAKPAAKEDPVREMERELNRILTGRDAPPKKIESLKLLLRNLKAAGAGSGNAASLAARTDKEIHQLEASLEEDAGKELGKLDEKLKPLLESSSVDLAAVNALVDAFPVDRFKGTTATAKIDALKARIGLLQKAEMEYSLRKDKLGDYPVKNIALLEGYDPAYAGTPSFEEVQKLIKENYKIYVEKREAKAAQESKAKWDLIDVRSHKVIWPEGNNFDCTEAKDDVLSIGPNKEAYLTENPKMANEAGTIVQIGDDGWIDIEVRFEAQITDVANIYFGARGNLGLNNLYNFSWKGLGGLGINDQEWHPLVIRIEGPLMEITASGMKSVENDKIGLLAGPFGIRVTGGKAAIKLRKVQVWVINKEAPPEGEGGGEKEKGSGKKKGAGKKAGGK